MFACREAALRKLVTIVVIVTPDLQGKNAIKVSYYYYYSQTSSWSSKEQYIWFQRDHAKLTENLTQSIILTSS